MRNVLLPALSLLLVACVGVDAPAGAIDAGTADDAAVVDAGGADAAGDAGTPSPGDAAAPGDDASADAGPAGGCTLTVGPGLTAPTLDDAVAQVPANGTICLRAGTYASGDGQTYPLTLKAGVTLRRAPAATQPVILQGLAGKTTVAAPGGATLQELTFVGGGLAIDATGATRVVRSEIRDAAEAARFAGAGALTITGLTVTASSAAAPPPCLTGITVGGSLVAAVNSLSVTGYSHAVVLAGDAAAELNGASVTAPPNCKKPSDAQTYAAFAVQHNATGKLTVAGGTIAGANALILVGAAGPLDVNGMATLRDGQDGIRHTGTGLATVTNVTFEALTRGIWLRGAESSLTASALTMRSSVATGLETATKGAVSVMTGDFTGATTGLRLAGNSAATTVRVDFGVARSAGVAVAVDPAASGFATLTGSRFASKVQSADQFGFYAAGFSTDSLGAAAGLNFSGQVAGRGAKF